MTHPQTAAPVLTEPEIMQAMLGDDLNKGKGHPFLVGTDDFIEAARAIEAAVLAKVSNSGGQIAPKPAAGGMDTGSKVVGITGRDLYNESIKYADDSLPALPEWCDLTDEDQNDWNERAREES